MANDLISDRETMAAMTAPYFRYWGKADGPDFHPAPFHCLDVAAVAERWLLADGVLRDRLSQMTGWSERAVGPTVAFFCAAHDFGKFAVGFQMKVPAVAVALCADRQGLPSDTYDHGAWGYHHLRDIGPDCGFDSSLNPLWLAVTGHHGSFPSARRPALHPSYRRLAQADDESRRCWLRDLRRLFAGRGLDPVPPPGGITMATVELLAGLCSVSDWLGSQREFFPYERQPYPLSDYYETALGGAHRALEAIGLCSGRASGRSFVELFPDYVPKGLQATTESLSIPEGPCLLILEAETGSGKTEAALALAERLLTRGAGGRLFFALPTMATSNAMFERIEAVADRLFDGSINLLLAHSRSRTNKAFQRLAERSVLTAAPACDTEASVACARWFLSRKRVLLGQIGVGTVDQALLSVLRVRHHFVRAFALGLSTLIVDEVHAYDVYMEVILERLIEWLGALGAPVILLSATLPTARRGALASAYRRGLGKDEPATSAQTTAAYPLVTVASREVLFSVPAQRVGESRRVAIRRLQTPRPVADVLPQLVEAARAGAMVVWIRNTVREAMEAYKQLDSADVPRRLFHARFRPGDRQIIETAVLQHYGRKTTRREGALLVATQVVEQSLDIDFDLLFTDLAPIDLILQRVGRLHRHERRRPKGFESPTLVVVEPSDADAQQLHFGPSAKVYDPVTLWLARDTLRDRNQLLLPNDLRELIEDSYDATRRLQRIERARDAGLLMEAEKKLTADIAARRGRAASVCIPPTETNPAAISSFDDDEEGLRALTRDGDSASLILVAWDGIAARSIDGTEWKPNSSAPDSWRLARDLAGETIGVSTFPWLQYLRGLPPFGVEAWTDCESRLCGVLGGFGTRSILVPVVANGRAWQGRVETTCGVRTLSYSRDGGLDIQREGSDD